MQQTIDPIIFRAYDIRGIVGENLTEETMKQLGLALGRLALEKGEKSIVLGRDGRLTSPMLAKVLCESLLETGCDVIDVGVVPTPLLYYSTFVFDTHSALMVTGSHNGPEYNGLKIMLLRESLAGDAIQNIYHRIQEKNYVKAKIPGDPHHLEIIERYLTHVIRDVKLKRKLKIVIDCGNGVTSNVAPELYRQMGCNVIELFCEVDGHFPNHHPDPTQPENMRDLINKVRQTKADLGIAFDGDGDRLGVVTSEGEIIWPDRLLMLLAQDVLKRNPGAKIIYDVKCSSHLEKVIRAAGGIPIMWKTGHSFIKAKLVETQALLAGEMSGHIFFREGWYGFDDALYAGARLLGILSSQSLSSHELFQTIPNSINTPELKLRVTENEKFSMMKDLISHANFQTGQINTIDGLRVNFSDGWGLVRPSNTSPYLVFRFEAETSSSLEKIKNDFRKNLLAVKPDLVLPF